MRKTYKSILFMVLVIAFVYGCAGSQRNKVAGTYELTGITLEASRQGIWAAYDSDVISKEKLDSLLVEYEKARKLFRESGVALKISMEAADRASAALFEIETEIKKEND